MVSNARVIDRGFSAVLDNMMRLVGAKTPAERSLALGAATLTAAVAVVSPLAIAAGTAAGGTALYTAFKFAPRLLESMLDDGRKRISRIAARFGESMGEMVNAFLDEHRGDAAAAISAGNGLWLVRRAGAEGYRVMQSDEFRRFELAVAWRGDTLNKVSVTHRRMTLMRYRGGKLDGPTAEFPATEAFSADGRRAVVLVANGILIDAPTQDVERPQEFGVAMRR